LRPGTPTTSTPSWPSFDPERADLDGWLVLDAREDGWMLVVCRNCQTTAERERVEARVTGGR
jgi:hypothetical protein